MPALAREKVVEVFELDFFPDTIVVCIIMIRDVSA